MPRATLTVHLPDGLWITELSRAHPEARFRVLAAMPSGDTGVGLVEVTAADLPAVLAAMDAHEGITALELLQTDADEALVQFETTQPLLLFSMQEAGLPLDPPIDIVDGSARLDVTGSRDRLSALREGLETFGFRFEVERVYQDVSTDPLLSDRQRRLVVEAVERGYYDTPRGCTLTELAEDLGIAKSTASETLHRAEGRIVRSYVEGLPPIEADPESAASDAGHRGP